MCGRKFLELQTQIYDILHIRLHFRARIFGGGGFQGRHRAEGRHYGLLAGVENLLSGVLGLFIHFIITF